MPARGRGFHVREKAPETGAFSSMKGCYLTRSMKVRSTVFTRIFSPASM